MSVENTVVRAAGAAPLTVTLYEIDFTLSSDTLTALDSGNYNLYGFKAVQTSQGGGAPLVWFQLAPNHFSTSMTLKWTEQYQAYTSSSEITPGYQITAGYSAPVTLGQTLQVGANGFGPVVGGGDPQAISINNTIAQQFTCGISQSAADGSTNPLCAFPLYGNQLDVIVPIEKVLLLFSTTPVNTGAVVEQAYGPGILVDLTGATPARRGGIAYDINLGWSWGAFSWGQSVAAKDTLVPLLITS